MGVPPVQKWRAGRPSHKNDQIVSYLILIPYDIEETARAVSLRQINCRETARAVS